MVQAIAGNQLLNQLGFALGDSIAVRQLPDLRVVGDGLAQDRAAEGIRLEQAVYLRRQLLLEQRPAGWIAAVHADQDGVGRLVEVSAAKHGAYQGVDRHFKVTSLKIHVSHNFFGVLVAGEDGENLFLLVDGDFYAGVYIQGNGGGYVMVDLVKHPQARSACKESERRRDARGPSGPAFLFGVFHF